MQDTGSELDGGRVAAMSEANRNCKVQKPWDSSLRANVVCQRSHVSCSQCALVLSHKGNEGKRERCLRAVMG